jgi:alpha-tubulin suppressor-like RCC1 family protein
MKNFLILFLCLISLKSTSQCWNQISVGTFHTLAITTDGTLWAWGKNDLGQLGDGTNINKNTPVRIGTESNWSKICAGADFTIAIKTDGTLWAWGNNLNGQLGDGTNTNKNVPTRIGTSTNWSEISAGTYHVLAIKTTGTLWAWGQNSYNILGLSIASVNVPTQVGTATNWSKVSTKLWHSIAIKTDGTLWGWGRNNIGQLGNGTTTNLTTPTKIGIEANWVSVSVGAYHTIAIKTNGTLWAWGENGYYQLGDGTTNNKNIPSQIGTNINWSKIYAGEYHNHAIKTDGTLWSWGSNGYGVSGNGTTNGNIYLPTQIGTSTNWSKVSTWRYHSIGIKGANEIWAWGYNLNGQLGDGTNIDKNSPVYVNCLTSIATITTTTVSSISSTSAYSGGNITNDGDSPVTARGVCWNTQGNPTISDFKTTNGSGIGLFNSSLTNLASNTTFYVRAYATNGVGTAYGNQEVFTTPPCLWQRIDAGFNHTIAIKSDGTLWTWGRNDFGQLGDGTTTNKNLPTQISAASWSEIAAGNSFSLGIKTDGTLWAWGKNDVGQLADGTYNNKYAPVQIGTSNNWSKINTAKNHVLALKTDGTLWVWGDNTYWQLGVGYGNGLIPNKNTPTQVGNNNDWREIVAGGDFSIAIKADSTLWTWGRNNYGQLGDGTSNNRFEPILIVGPNNWIKISAGEDHSHGIKADGTLWSWGNNLVGQLGSGTASVVGNVPSQIGTETNWSELNSGGQHTLARKTDNTIWSWGYNSYGQLGDGTSTNKNAPSLVNSLSNCSLLNAGTFHSCAIKTDGTLWCWGSNTFGQLGNGTTSSTNFPSSIICPSVTILNTLIVDSVTSNSASSGGNIFADGGFPVTERGVCWSAMGTPTIFDNKSMDGAGNGIYTSSLTNLISNSTYYVRAYATNLKGTAYGNLQTLTTLSCIASVTATALQSTICSGATTTLSQAGLTNCVWSPGAATTSSVNVSPTITTTYTVSGTNSNGCTGNAIITVTVNPLPVVSAIATPATISNGDSSLLTQNGLVNFTWSPGGYTTSPIYVSPTTTTTYTLSGVDSQGCTGNAVVIINVINTVGLTESSNQSNFSIYPNPAQNFLNIKADKKLIGENFFIYDNLGKSVLTGKISSENTTIDLGILSSGVYLFSIGENIKQTFKVVKE